MPPKKLIFQIQSIIQPPAAKNSFLGGAKNAVSKHTSIPSHSKQYAIKSTRAKTNDGKTSFGSTHMMLYANYPPLIIEVTSNSMIQVDSGENSDIPGGTPNDEIHEPESAKGDYFVHSIFRELPNFL